MFKVVHAVVGLLGLVLVACGSDPTAEPSTSILPTTTTEAQTTTTTEARTTTTTEARTTTTTEAQTTTTTEAVTEILVTVAGGEVTQGGGRHEIALDSQVRLIVAADVTDEVHVHGYDLFADVEPAAPARIEFPADIPGVFEVELEGSHLPLTELEVS